MKVRTGRKTETLRDYIAINEGELDVKEINNICYGICQDHCSASITLSIGRLIREHSSV